MLLLYLLTRKIHVSFLKHHHKTQQLIYGPAAAEQSVPSSLKRKAANNPSMSRESSLSSLTSIDDDEEAISRNEGSQPASIFASLIGRCLTISQGPFHRPRHVKPGRFIPRRAEPSNALTTASTLTPIIGDADPPLILSSASISTSTTMNASPPLQPTRADCAVEAFLNDLESPSGHLLQYFYEMEIDTESNLDHVCRMDERMWEEVKTYLLGKGVSLFRWLVVKKGLKDRAASLLPVS